MSPSEGNPPDAQLPITVADDFELLRAFLACDDLPRAWHYPYGIRRARAEALTKRSRRKAGYSSDSFINPNSETALSLFVLANTDGWKQFNAFMNLPRVSDKNWNRKFFADLLSRPVREMPSDKALWRCHTGVASLFGDDRVDWNKLMLLFEFEVAGTAFHQRKTKQGKFSTLSFLKIDTLKKWSKFDAVLIDPTNECFYFIEAKLGSDSSTGTKKYTHVNQIVRSLEAAFWLTTHQESMYHGWRFRYIFVSPRLIHDYKLRYYAFALNAVDEILTNYHRLLRDVYGSELRLDTASFDQQYELFKEKASQAVRMVYWDAFGKVLLENRPEVWNGYFARIRDCYGQARPEANADKIIGNIKKRLRVAGIEYRE